jgi:glycogen debranching enzyme/glycosyltransferase involved in cell wall biosynthesis
MKIAQVAPLFETVPPSLYGGTERVIAHLIDALVDLGHEVTLFASGDSITKAHLVNCRAQAIWLDKNSLTCDIAAHLSLLHEVRKRAREFDIIHFHLDMLHFPIFEDIADRTITTLHGRLDFSDYPNLYKRWPQYPLVSISNSQRKPLNFANWANTVYHGLPVNHYKPTPKPDNGYLAFIGRFAPEKQPHVAIRVAQRMGRTIKIAAKVDNNSKRYFAEQIEPMLELPGVDYVGQVGDRDKCDFLGHAQALIFPIAWPEPFGMVMIEAMACGTPIIAWNCGSVPEVVKNGVTGFIVNNEDEAVEALRRVHELDRNRIREEFERRFDSVTMAKNYEDTYQQQSAKKTLPTATGSEAGSQMAAELTGASEPATVESDDSTMPYKLLALKDMDTFVVANAMGDIIGKGDGLFRNDTRVLSNWRLMLAEKPLSLLSSDISQDDVFFGAHITNRPLPPLGQSAVPEGIIHIERNRFLWQERLYESVHLVNYGEEEVLAPISLHFGADFRDIFEVRGQKRPARGDVQEPAVHDDHVLLSYCSRDKILHQTAISFSQRPNNLTESSATFELVLPRKETVEIFIEVGPSFEEIPTRKRFRDAAAKARRSMRKRRLGGGRIHAPDHIFDGWVQKSRSDLALLTTDLPTGPYPYAGIPWFSTPFGRDAVITAMQMLWFDPRVAQGVLRFLAQNQTDEHSSFRDAAPGKIMHETRKGEMSRMGEVPFGLYYGGVDTTPLFVILANEYADRTANMGFIEEIWPAVESAIDWIEHLGDSNGDGFLDYQSGEASGLRNQGWKDSEDSVFHADGRFPDGPIALSEVQGYKYGALTSMASLCARRGDDESAAYWRKRAEQVRADVEQHFWMEDKEFYGLAIDGHGELCRVRASNAGHLLFVGLPSDERGKKVAQQLVSSRFDSGWGIRTLANDEARYNPMSYHNGSVWPHDTAICAAGIARYGDRAAAARILGELFGAAVHFGMRLPELYCGFQRIPGEIPVAYPVACLPQAWSSGAVFMTLQACLGIHIDAWRKEICITEPELPDGINRIVLRDIAVGDSSVSLVFQRVRDRITVFSHGERNDDIRVITLL